MITDRAAAILGASILLAVGVYLYFSPYQQCVRELRADRGSGFEDTHNAAAVCLSRMGSR